MLSSLLWACLPTGQGFSHMGKLYGIGPLQSRLCEVTKESALCVVGKKGLVKRYVL